MWLSDFVDLHTEWGAAPATSASASVGASTLALTGLQSGSGVTLSSGTSFQVVSAGLTREYRLAADATVTAGAATVTLATVVTQPIASGDRCIVKAEFRGAFNRKTGRQYFADADLQALAQRAQQQWDRVIAESLDTEETLLRGAAALGLKQELDDAGFREVIVSGDQDAGDKTLQALEATRKQYIRELTPYDVGPHTISLSR